MTDEDIVTSCAELEMDGEIGFNTTCRATARSHIRRINEWLSENHYDWRAELTIDK